MKSLLHKIRALILLPGLLFTILMISQVEDFEVVLRELGMKKVEYMFWVWIFSLLSWLLGAILILIITKTYFYE